MHIRSISDALRGVLDQVAAGALIVFPFVLGFGALELWLSVAGGALLLAYNAFTDYRPGVLRAAPSGARLMLDFEAAILFAVAPFPLGFAAFATIYYFVTASGVAFVAALTSRAAPVLLRAV